MTTETHNDITDAEKRAHARRMAAMKNKAFMSGVIEALDEESRGGIGKTLEEIRQEHGLTH